MLVWSIDQVRDAELLNLCVRKCDVTAEVVSVFQAPCLWSAVLIDFVEVPHLNNLWSDFVLIIYKSRAIILSNVERFELVNRVIRADQVSGLKVHEPQIVWLNVPDPKDILSIQLLISVSAVRRISGN